MTNLEQEAATARMMVQAGGKKAIVLIVEIDGDRSTMMRSISPGISHREARIWIGALNREREKIALIFDINPDEVKNFTAPYRDE